MTTANPTLLEEKYASTLEKLCDASLQISQILEVIIESRVVDTAVASQKGQKCEISLSAGRMLDASHFSMALHAFYAAKFQNIELRLPKEPPENLDAVGHFYWKSFLVDLDLKPKGSTTRSLAKIGSTLKRRTIDEGKKKIFRLLNTLVRLHAHNDQKFVLYGTLYNVHPRLSSIADFFSFVKKSLRGNLLAIEYSDFYKLSKACKSPVSLHLRESLQTLFAEVLSRKFPHLQLEIADLSCFLAGTIPISNLEARIDNFQIASKFAKSLHPAAVVSSNGFASEKHTSFLAAACKQLCNSTIIGIQHGGYYGYTRNHGQAFNTEYQFLDYLLTWGWGKNKTFLGTIRTKMIPIGSFHLRDLSLRSTQGRGDQAATSKIQKILLIAGPYLYTYPRCEQQVGRELIDNYLIPINSKAIARLANQIGGNLYLKGGYVKLFEDHYFGQIALRSNELGVRCQQIDSKLRAYDLFPNYDLIIFDSIGTGFFESIALNVPTLLLPSARQMPSRDARDTLSELFFTDTFQSTDKYWTVFQDAKKASLDFLNRFGKSSDSNIFDVIADMEILSHK